MCKDEEHMSASEKRIFAAEWNAATGLIMHDQDRMKLALMQQEEIRKAMQKKIRKMIANGADR